MLRNLAHTIIKNCAAAYGMGPRGREMVDAQMFCLAEEAGEAVGAWRRFTWRARRNGTKDAFEEEVADTVIAAYCVAEAADFDLDAVIARKAQKVLTRGWKEVGGA